MLIKYIERVGEKTILSITSLYSFLVFATLSLSRLFYFRNYDERVVSSLVIQIYYTSVIIIPHFIIIASLFGSLIIGSLIIVSMQFNFQTQIGSIITTFVFNEFAPLFTTLFIALRSGTLINKKFAKMSRKTESEIVDKIALPKIISGVISTLTLSVLFTSIVLGSGYIVIFIYMGMDFHTYKFLLLDAISVENIAMLLIKSILYGFLTMIVPIYIGLKYKDNRYLKDKTSALPLLAYLFSAIFFIEMLLFFIKSTLKGIV
jgi:phospholipid/cholesterol/gamma-HCH transport system permease protein